MSNETTGTNVHNTSTEILIIMSQTVFFVLLFLLLKNWLIDKRGMLGSKERINEELYQIIAIFFAILVIVGLFMIPIESYEYAHYVVPITYVVIILIIGWEVYFVTYRAEASRVSLSDLEFAPAAPTATKKTDNTQADVGTSSSSKFWFGAGPPSSSKRPVNF